ncbi:hypothetical protein D3C81_1090640 [compost metagenome]
MVDTQALRFDQGVDLGLHRVIGIPFVAQALGLGGVVHTLGIDQQAQQWRALQRVVEALAQLKVQVGQRGVGLDALGQAAQQRRPAGMLRGELGSLVVTGDDHEHAWQHRSAVGLATAEDQAVHLGACCHRLGPALPGVGQVQAQAEGIGLGGGQGPVALAQGQLGMHQGAAQIAQADPARAALGVAGCPVFGQLAL